MFESLFSNFKSLNQEATAQAHIVEGMTMQKLSSPASPVAERVIDQQPVGTTILILILEELTKSI